MPLRVAMSSPQHALKPTCCPHNQLLDLSPTHCPRSTNSPKCNTTLTKSPKVHPICAGWQRIPPAARNAGQTKGNQVCKRNIEKRYDPFNNQLRVIWCADSCSFFDWRLVANPGICKSGHEECIACAQRFCNCNGILKGKRTSNKNGNEKKISSNFKSKCWGVFFFFFFFLF